MDVDRLTESTGVKLSRDKSRRRLRHERPHFNQRSKEEVGNQSGSESNNEDVPAILVETATSGLRRSKSLHAKGSSGGKRPDGYREQNLLLWHSSKTKKKIDRAKQSDEDKFARPDSGGERHPHEQELSYDPPKGTTTKPHQTDFVERLVSVIGDVSCPLHADRSIQVCPRECGWNLEE